MQYIEATEQKWEEGAVSLFLAGGISGCPDWQQEIVQLLSDTSLMLFNPRRANFPIHNPAAAREQIEWEHAHLRYATAIAFWFPCETLCPITLYELGAWSMTSKHLFVGIHPGYQRLQDVQIQTELVRPDVSTKARSIEELSQEIVAWTKS